MPSGDAHRSLARALDILELCSLNGSGYTLTQLSQHLGIAKGSISPLLHTLLARGYLTLDDQLAEIRVSGFAYECEESTRGIRCIGVPLRKSGKVVAALSVAFPLERYNDAAAASARQALDEARRQIERLLCCVELQF